MIQNNIQKNFLTLSAFKFSNVFFLGSMVILIEYQYAANSFKTDDGNIMDSNDYPRICISFQIP